MVTAADVAPPPVIYASEVGEIKLRPITVMHDPRGLGIFIDTKLLEFAAVNGPYFNGPGLPGLKVLDANAFANTIGRLLTLSDGKGSTLVTEMLDAAILWAASDGCDGIDCTPPAADAAG
jgi:hypothetical protein